MFDWGFCETIMRQTYEDWLRETEKNRHARQAQTGHRRCFRPLSWVRIWFGRSSSLPGMAWQGHFRRAVEEVAKVSSSGGGLIL
jgi:hypothetical protein